MSTSASVVNTTILRPGWDDVPDIGEFTRETASAWLRDVLPYLMSALCHGYNAQHEKTRLACYILLADLERLTQAASAALVSETPIRVDVQMSPGALEDLDYLDHLRYLARVVGMQADVEESDASWSRGFALLSDLLVQHIDALADRPRRPLLGEAA